jgi:hypothetical protein
MDSKQFNKDKVTSWEYIPDTDTLLKYLDRIDFKELSKCCKRYRKQFEPKVLESLSISHLSFDKWDIPKELTWASYEKILECIETDLGIKLKFVKKFTFDCNINCPFGEKLVELLPNIKSLRLIETCQGECRWERSVITILKGMKHLEHAELEDFWESLSHCYTNEQIFPKSLKSLKVYSIWANTFHDNNVMIYDTIDSRFTNLHSISIACNKVLQNLACGMPNLKEVEILEMDHMDQSKFVEFLKANPQLEKLNTNLKHYSEEILKTILSFKHLKQWINSSSKPDEAEVNSLISNYSIKYLKFKGCKISTSLVQKIISACKSLETLEFVNYPYFNGLDWLKLEQRVNFLKITDYPFPHTTIKGIDSSRLFNQIHIKLHYSLEDFINKYNNDKLNNYSFIPPIIKHGTAKLINKN